MFVKQWRNKISKWGVRETRILRYALGSTLAMAIALGYAWPLSYLVPVLILGFLDPKSTPPTIKSSINFILILLIACLLGAFISQYLLSYPLIHIPLLGLLFLHLFYAKKSSINKDLKTWVMIAGLMIPILGLSDQGMAIDGAVNIMIGGLIMTGINLFIYMIVPESEIEKKELSSILPAPEMSSSSRMSEAISSLLVIMPIVVLFYLFNWYNYVLVLIFVAILGSTPAISKSFATGKAMIIGNLFGGIMSLIIYEFLVMVPHFYFLIWVMFAAALYFGTELFSDKKMAPLYGMAFSTLIIVIGSTTTGTSEAGDKVWIRVIQIAVAVTYVVLAYRFIDKWSEANGNNELEKLEVV